MLQVLKIHPHSRCTAVTRIEVEITRPISTSLAMDYFVFGQLNNLHLPVATPPARADELWRSTCFEAFVRPAQSASYYEFNSAPSMQWAAYRFSGYRSGMTIPNEVRAPKLDASSSDSCYRLRVALQLDRLADLASDATWEINLSAVIEETSGHKSYWALAHPPGRADFHHSDCFVLKLPTA